MSRAALGQTSGNKIASCSFAVARGKIAGPPRIIVNNLSYLREALVTGAAPVMLIVRTKEINFANDQRNRLSAA